MRRTARALPGHTVAVDLLRQPLLGRFLRWRFFRLTFQLVLLLLSVLLLYDGFFGDSLAARNLATVTIWVHFRGIAILLLLLVGNIFCMACPFTIPRSLARWRGPGRLKWPSVLKTKVISVGSLFLLFFLYEWLDIWRSPWLTAWLLLTYFVAAFVIEALFFGSMFCKYLCPLGAFNFVYSELSPTQIAVRNPAACLECRGKECIRGSSSIAGCGTLLYPPTMRSNMDCTLCLDCVRACPHSNIGLMVGMPGRILKPTVWKEKWSFAVLSIGLTAMALMNAFGMTPPIYRGLALLKHWLGPNSDGASLFIIWILGCLCLPLAATFLMAWISRSLSRSLQSLTQLVGQIGPAFVPLGFMIWAAHYLFHFLTGALTIIPVTHYFLKDHGWIAGNPDFSLAQLIRPSALDIVEIGLVAVGFVWSFYTAWQIQLQHYSNKRYALRAVLPWTVLLALIAWCAVVIFGFPMEMRGTES